MSSRRCTGARVSGPGKGEGEDFKPRDMPACQGSLAVVRSCSDCGAVCVTAVHECSVCGSLLCPSAEEDPLAALYSTFAAPLLRAVRRRAIDMRIPETLVDTEGVVQETFLALLRSRNDIQDPAAWLFTVARRIVDRTAVHQGRIVAADIENCLSSGEVIWASLPLQASPEDLWHARKVMEAIANLPNKQKITVYLSRVEGWSHAEIGDYLQCAVATVGVHLHRGTARLRRWLNYAERTTPIIIAIVVVYSLQAWPSVPGMPVPLHAYSVPYMLGPARDFASLEYLGPSTVVGITTLIVFSMTRVARARLSTEQVGEFHHDQTRFS